MLTKLNTNIKQMLTKQSSNIKQLITNEEIEYILSDLKINVMIPQETADSMLAQIKETVRKQLIGMAGYRQNIPILKEIVEKEFTRAQLDPGTFIGMLTSLNLGSLYTQSVLNSFHTAGISRLMSSNLGRLEEILNLIQNPHIKQSIIYFDSSFKKNNKHDTITAVRRKFLRDIEYKSLNDFVLSLEVFYRKTLDENETMWYKSFLKLSDIKIWNRNHDFYYDWMIRLKIDEEVLYECSLTLEDLADIINTESFDLYCLCSTQKEMLLDVYVDTSLITIPQELKQDFHRKEASKAKKKRKKYKSNSIPETFAKIKEELKIQSSSEDSEESEEEIYISEKIIAITEDNKNYNYIVNVVQYILLGIKICGIDDIDKCYIEELNNEYIVTTEGGNFRDLIISEGIDWKRTVTSFIWELFDVLGIEAVRRYIYEELNKSFNSNNYVHLRYSKLVVDVMTQSGRPCSVNRYGIDKNQTGPLSRASFEEQMDNLLLASINNEVDDSNAVSSSVILGKSISGGTNSFDIKMNIERIMELYS